MRRTLFTVFLIALAFNSNAATVLETLKSTPASRYEVGLLSLEIGAFVLTRDFRHRHLLGTNFSLNKFDVDEEEGRLFFRVYVEGAAQRITKESCEQVLKVAFLDEIYTKILRSLWSDLTEDQYKQLEDEIFLTVTLVAAENEELQLDCLQ